MGRGSLSCENVYDKEQWLATEAYGSNAGATGSQCRLAGGDDRGTPSDEDRSKQATEKEEELSILAQIERASATANDTSHKV